MGSNSNIDRAFKDAVSDGIFPAADLLVAKKGEVIYSAHYGNARDETCFDISSLTKPVSTATLTMILVAEGLLKLDDTVYQWLGGARGPHHKRITIRHLLDHTSGLPAWQPYFRELPASLVGTDAGRQLIVESCYNEPPVSEPGTKTIYSDIGYIILGEIVAQAAGVPLDALFMQHIARPLGLSNTFFVRIVGAIPRATTRRTETTSDQHVPTPKHGFASERDERKEGGHRRFAPTEDCPWRERVIHGEVHDQNAYALGGVAGHAGLFSTASELHKFQLEFSLSVRGESSILPKDVVQEFVRGGQMKPTGDEYVLGWMRPSRRNSASGHYFSANSIGHLGYTGCSMWADLKGDFWIIILTNRIHPSSTNEKIKAFRPHIHDLIYKEVIK